MTELWEGFSLLTWGRATLLALGAASLSGAIAVALVAITCRFVPRVPAAVASLLWWGVSLKLLLAVGGIGLEVPVLPAAPLSAARSFESRLAISLPAEPSSGPDDRRAEAISASPRDWGGGARWFPWWQTLALLWASGVVAGCIRTVVELFRLKALLGRATAVDPPWLGARLRALARQLGLRCSPRLLSSPEVATPQLVGFVRPSILLPADTMARMSPAELEMMLAHELAHLHRRDLWLGWVPWLAGRLFFFHPAVAWAVREYALAREAACDGLALELLGSAPREYGRMLLRWGVVPRETGLAAAAASPSAKTLKRRLEMLGRTQNGTGRPSRGAWWGAAMALVVLLPLQWVKADGNKKGGEGVRISGTMMNYDSGSRREGWVYVDKIEDETLSVIMDGRFELRNVKEMALEKGAPLLFVRRQGEVFALVDDELMAKAQALFQPMMALGEEQGRLGERQGELGEQQGALGEQQGELGERQGELGEALGRLGARMGELAEELAELVSDRAGRDEKGSEARREKLEGEMRQVEQKMEALSRDHGSEGGELGERQETLARQQEALGRQQEVLGRQQEELGRRQEKLVREAEGQIERLLDEALASGKAEKMR